MVVDPPVNPVTTPVLLTEATDGLEDTQALLRAGVPEPTSAEVVPAQNALLPVRVGRALTVMEIVAVQPFDSV